MPFPTDIAQRLADSTNASLTPMDAADRWAAMLEAAAFSPIRALVRPTRKPDAVSDELLATVNRLAPALPHVAELFEIEVPAKAAMPKPLRPGPRPAEGQGTDRRPPQARRQAGQATEATEAGQARGDRPARGRVRGPARTSRDAHTRTAGYRGSGPHPNSRMTRRRQAAPEQADASAPEQQIPTFRPHRTSRCARTRAGRYRRSGRTRTSRCARTRAGRYRRSGLTEQADAPAPEQADTDVPASHDAAEEDVPAAPESTSEPEPSTADDAEPVAEEPVNEGDPAAAS